MKSYLKKFFLPKLPEDLGEVLIEWQVPEYTKQERSKKWLITLLILTIAVIIFCVFTMNFLFAIIILLFVFIVVLRHFREPEKYPVKITEYGVVINEKFFPYKEVEKFWLVYFPPTIKNLNLDFKDSFRSDITIYLEDVNPLLVREILNQYILEDLERVDESFLEKISRIVKL